MVKCRSRKKRRRIKREVGGSEEEGKDEEEENDTGSTGRERYSCKEMFLLKKRRTPRNKKMPKTKDLR